MCELLGIDLICGLNLLGLVDLVHFVFSIEFYLMLALAVNPFLGIDDNNLTVSRHYHLLFLLLVCRRFDTKSRERQNVNFLPMLHQYSYTYSPVSETEVIDMMIISFVSCNYTQSLGRYPVYLIVLFSSCYG